MRVKVSKKFRDKYTNCIYQAGEVIEIDDKRLEEILSKGKLVEIIEDEASDELLEEKIDNIAEVVDEPTEEKIEVIDKTDKKLKKQK